jgi:hypothetical protein
MSDNTGSQMYAVYLKQSRKRERGMKREREST